MKNSNKVLIFIVFFYLGFYFYLFFVVEMQEPYLITKLESAEKTWKDLSVCLKSFE